MMKKLKQFGALMLALVLAVALCCPALAAEEKGSITIDNAINGQTYTIYRIFDLESYNKDAGTYSYTVNNKWKNFFESGADGLNYVTVTDGYVTWSSKNAAGENINVDVFASKAFQYATSNNIVNDGTTKAANEKVEFKDLPLGYYLVQSSTGTLCALNTTDPDAEITEKNALPTVDKQVQEDSTGNWGKTNDADIGQTVNFKTVITVTAGNSTNYKLHDKMSEGLTFNSESVAIERNNDPLKKGTEYTLKTTELADSDCTFEIEFNSNLPLNPGDKITVTYSATLNEKAVIASTGNPNDTKLTYGNNQSTEWSQTRTYTWKMDVYKYTGTTENGTPLSGAEFVLRNKENKYLQYKKNDANVVVGINWVTDQKDATVFVTPANGRFSIERLDADQYELVETKAPDGYNKLKDAINVTITANIANDNIGTATVTYGDGSIGEVKVLNNAGTELPTTGGMGTTVLYVVGGVLVVCAGVALVAKKRMQ